MATLELNNANKKTLFNELFSKENRLLLHKKILGKLKLTEVSKESKKNILDILQKNMKAIYEKQKNNSKLAIEQFNSESIDRTTKDLIFLRSIMNNFNSTSFEKTYSEIILNKLLSNENLLSINEKLLAGLNLKETNKSNKEKIIEIIKKKMQLVSSKLQPSMINEKNFESIMDQFMKMSYKEATDQLSHQKKSIAEPNASKLKFERDFNSIPNKGNKMMDRPIAQNKNQGKFLYPPGFEQNADISKPDPRFDKLFQPIVDNVDDNYKFNNYQSGRGGEQFNNTFEKLMSERDFETALPQRPPTPDFLKSVNTSGKGPQESNMKNTRSAPEVRKKGGKPNFSQSIPEEELDTGFMSANDNNDLYDINNIDKPVESMEFEEDHRPFAQRLKSLERDRTTVSTELVVINKEVDDIPDLQPKSIDEIRKEKEEKALKERYQHRDDEEDMKIEEQKQKYAAHLKLLKQQQQKEVDESSDSDESPKPVINPLKIQEALKRLGIQKKEQSNNDLIELKKENKSLKKKLSETTGFDVFKKEIGTEFTKLQERELEIKKKEEEMGVLLKKYNFLYGLKQVQMDISPQNSPSKYVFNFNKIDNIHGIKLMSYSIPVPRYNIEEDKNNVLKIKIKDEITEIKLNSGKYKIDDLLSLLTKKSDFNFELNLEEKVEISGKEYTEFDIIPTPLSTEVLGFTKEYTDDNSYEADKTWDLRIEDKIYLFINNIEEKIPFAVLYIGNQAVQQFKFDEPIELDNLEIEFKDSKGRPFNFYGLTYSINVQVEIAETNN